MAKPARMAAMKMLVPVAESQLIAYTAASGCACGTTGGTRKIIWCSVGTGRRMTEIPSSHAFMLGRPHTNTRTLRMIQGVQARRTSAAVCAGAARMSSGTPATGCSSPPAERG
jgi:hypothetical protein